MLNFYTASTVYVSQTEGCDDWTGFCEKPQPQYRFGPVKTLERALEMVIRARATGNTQPMTVCIMGEYFMEKPLELGAAFGEKIEGVYASPSISGLTFEAHPKLGARLIGGRRITGVREGVYNGVRCLCAPVPEAAAGTWRFTDLVVNGVRATPARYPKNRTLRAVTTEHPNIATEKAPIHDTSGGSHWFVARKEDLQGISGIENATVSFYHWWIDEHCPVKSYDAATGRVELACRTRFRVTAEYEQDYTGNLEYYLENVPDEMSDAGEWFLDCEAGMLYYIPREGETAENVELLAPVTGRLFHIAGTAQRRVNGIRLRGLELTCTRGDYMSYDKEDGEYCGADAQSVHGAPGAVSFVWAADCAVENCTLHGLGLHAVEILEGCDGIRIENCRMEQLGAGGVKVFGTCAEELVSAPERATHHITVRSCRILHCGRRYAAACGVLICHANGCEVADNEVAWLDYTGISVGWVWGYAPNSTYGSRIIGNHVHHIGMGRLSDMGGLYFLGPQPGTVVRGNNIHDINSAHYGGNGIYTDQGAGDILFEENTIWRCKSACFTQHYGSRNVLRNNILAFGGICLVNSCQRDDAVPALLLEHNILLTDGVPVYLPLVCGQRGNRNLVWDVNGGEPMLCQDPTVIGLEEWQRIFGRDEGSLAADPGFADAKNGDFTLPENSPFYTL